MNQISARHRVAIVAVALGAVCLGLAGFGASDGAASNAYHGALKSQHKAPSRASAKAPAAAAGTVTIAFPYQPDTLDPASGSQTIQSQIDRAIFDTLTWELANGRIVPDLATSWKVTNGGKTYTFNLRHGVTFQDGTPFNAKAVVAYFDRVENPATHAKSALASLGPFKSSRAVGKYKVVVQMKSAYAPFLTNLAQPPLGIESPTAVAKYGANFGDHPVGTGPFEVLSWVKGSSLTLERYPKYKWGPPALHQSGPAKISRLVYDFVESGAARIDELETGQAQLVDSTPALYYKTLKSNPSYREVSVSLGGSGEYAILNNSKFPTNSFAVRQAILYYVNRSGVIKLADQGVYPLLWGPLQQGMLGFDPAFKGMYRYNPGKGAKILEHAGWKKVGGTWTKGGKKLTLLITAISGVEDLPLLAQAIQGYLDKAGFVTHLDEMAEPAWNSAWERGQENMTTTWFTGVDPDILRETWTPSQPFDWNKYSNSKVTHLLDRAGSLTNATVRARLYQQAERIIMKQAATVPLHPNNDLVIMSSRLKGVQVSGGNMIFYTASIS